jgi:hypothetical protein
MLKLTGGSTYEGCIEVSPDPSRPRAFPLFVVLGPRNFIIDVTQQLAWLMAVFRNPVYGQLSSSEIHLQQISSQGLKLQARELSAVHGGKFRAGLPCF